MADIIFSHGIPILRKKVTWDEYKQNYQQDEIEYSQWSKNISTTGLKNKAKKNYQEQANRHRLKFQQKYSGIENPEKNIEVMAQLEALEAYLTQDVFKKAAEDAIADVLKNFNASKIMYPAMKQLASSKKGTDAYAKALAQVREAQKYFNDILNVQIPKAVLDSTKPRTTQNVAEALYLASGDPGAITSYLNTVQLLDSLTGVANEVPGAMTELGQLVFQKYSSNIDKNTLEDILRKKGTLGGDFDKYYKKGKEKIVAKTNRTIGNTMAKTTGTLFEIELPKAIVATAGEGVAKIIAETMAGVNVGDNKRQGKEDNIIELYGQKISLDKLGAKSHTTFNVPLLNPNDVKMNISVKQDKKRTGGTLQNPTVNTLFEQLETYTTSEEERRYSMLLYHYYQLYETSSGKNSSVMDAVNLYVMSRIADVTIGENIDFIVYRDGAVSKHLLLQEMAEGRSKFFRFHLRPVPNMFENVESSGGQIKNIKK